MTLGRSGHCRRVIGVDNTPIISICRLNTKCILTMAGVKHRRRGDRPLDPATPSFIVTPPVRRSSTLMRALGAFAPIILTLCITNTSRRPQSNQENMRKTNTPIIPLVRPQHPPFRVTSPLHHLTIHCFSPLPPPTRPLKPPPTREAIYCSYSPAPGPFVSFPTPSPHLIPMHLSPHGLCSLSIRFLRILTFISSPSVSLRFSPTFLFHLFLNISTDLFIQHTFKSYI